MLDANTETAVPNYACFVFTGLRRKYSLEVHRFLLSPSFILQGLILISNTQHFIFITETGKQAGKFFQILIKLFKNISSQPTLNVLILEQYLPKMYSIFKQHQLCGTVMISFSLYQKVKNSNNNTTHMQEKNTLPITEVSQKETLMIFKKIGFYALYILSSMIKLIGKKCQVRSIAGAQQCFSRN